MTAHPIHFTDHPFCSGLEPQHLQTLHGLSHAVRFQPGEFILQEGKSAQQLYLLQSGEVSLQIHPPSRGPVTLGTVGAGEVLGWSWMIPPYRWHLDAQALEPVEAFEINGERLRERCEHDAKLGYELMRRIASVLLARLQAARLQIIELYDQF